jgi:hypothetical protein
LTSLEPFLGLKSALDLAGPVEEDPYSFVGTERREVVETLPVARTHSVAYSKQTIIVFL